MLVLGGGAAGGGVSVRIAIILVLRVVCSSTSHVQIVVIVAAVVGLVPLVAFYPTSHPMPSPLAHPIIYHTPALCSRSPRFTISIVTVLAIVVAVVAGLVFQVPSRRRMASDLESPVISQVINTLGWRTQRRLRPMCVCV